MVRTLEVASVILATLSFILLCASTGTKRWKEDNDIYKGMRKYLGLWQGCVWVSGESVSGFPAYSECDRDFLRPQLVEPPGWFQAIRVLMLLACISAGFGIALMITAIVTNPAKNTGSKFWPSGLVVFIGGLCGLTALSIFTTKIQWSVQYAYSGGGYYATYWSEEPTESIVNGVFFKIETWLRWSYGVGWGGVALTFFTLLATILTDLTRGFY